MSDRPQPQLTRWGELVVPPEDLAEVSAWLTELCEYRSGRARPAAVKQTRVTAKLSTYTELAERGARDVAAGRAAALAAPRPAAPPVVALAQAPPPSAVDEITTSQAADITGLSAERMRQLAASGRVGARRTAHRARLLDRADVIALTGRSIDGATGSSEDGPGPRAA